MILSALRSYAGIASLGLLVSACGGGGGGGQQPPPPQPPAQNQTIAFATAGPVSGRAGTTVTNLASGGAGTGAITYASSDAAVATVNSTTGVATLLLQGTAAITATKAASTGFNAATATYQLNVTVETQTIAFAQAGPLTGRAGTTVTNVASGGAGTGAVTYTSSDTAVASVDAATGVATLLAPGTTTITATKAGSLGFGGATATYQLTAFIEQQTITFAQNGPLTGAVGSTITNAASGGAGTGAIAYVSSDTNVATVSASGVATLVAAGNATITATKAASIGYAAAMATYDLVVTQGTPQNQTITFAVPGPLNVLLGAVSTNVASGGAGTGAITYASNNTGAATVNATTGAVTAGGLGSATITATKAADPNFNAAQASYIVNVQSAGSVHAWVGEQMSEVFLPATANGKFFDRDLASQCGLVQEDLATCANVESSPVNGVAVLDNKLTLTTPAFYAIRDGANSGVTVLANTRRFSERILHGVAFFKNRYWVIGGGVPILPGSTPTIHTPQSDIWSSSDGKTWRLETANAAFGTRWLHQTLVFDNKIWVLGGLRTNNSGSSEVWSSDDGVNYTAVPQTRPWTGLQFIASMTATVFNNAMWIVIAGRTFSSTDGAEWTPQSAVGAIDSGFPREYASLTVYDNKLWYIGGSRVTPLNPGPPATFTRVAQNDVWRSTDGITWTQQATPPFDARHQHAAFVLNNKLWVFGGQRFNNVAGPPPKDAWSTTDGVTWTQEAQGTEIDFSWLMGRVQEPNRVTLIGGALRAYSNQVWQTTNGNNWTELAPFDFAPNLVSRGVVFKDAMWVIGGSRMDGLDTNEIWRSSDGLTWSRVNTSGAIFSPRDSHQALAFNDRLWVIGGWDFFATDGGTETFNNEVWSSADGVTWTQHMPSSGVIFSPRAGHQAVVFNGRMWVVGGNDGNQLYNDVWSSADGVNWVREQEHAAFSPRYTHSLVVFNNLMWVFAGSPTSPLTSPHVGLADAWRSADGRTWTQEPAPFPLRMEAATAVFNGRLFLLGGMSDDSYFTSTRYNDVWSTANGTNWELETPAAAFSGRNGPILLDYKGGLHLIGGFSITRTHDVWRSDDGIEWSAAFSHPISAP